MLLIEYGAITVTTLIYGAKTSLVFAPEWATFSKATVARGLAASDLNTMIVRNGMRTGFAGAEVVVLLPNTSAAEPPLPVIVERRGGHRRWPPP